MMTAMTRFIVACVVLTGLVCNVGRASDGRQTKKLGVTAEEIIEEISSSPWPADYALMAKLGVSGFTQIGSSASLNIRFWTGDLATSDGYSVERIEYRVSPRLDSGISFVSVTINEDGCLKAKPIRDRLAMTRYFTPPNPHSSANPAANATAYASDADGTRLFLTVTEKGDCLIGFNRSTK